MAEISMFHKLVPRRASMPALPAQTLEEQLYGKIVQLNMGADMDIVKLAAESAKAAEYYRLLGVQDTYGQSPEERAAASARYRMAQDAWTKAERAYQDAIAGLSADELSKLAAS